MVNTHSPRPGEATGGVQNQVWKKKGIYTENGSVILNLAGEHTQLTTYLEIGSRGGGGGGGRGVTKGQREGGREGGGTARVHLSGCVFLCGVSVHKL